MSNCNVRLTNWQQLAHPYYKLDFIIDGALFPVIPGDTIALQKAPFSFPIMNISLKNNQLSCLFKSPDKTDPTEAKKIVTSKQASKRFFFVRGTNKQYSTDKNSPGKTSLLLSKDEHIASLILHAKLAQNSKRTLFAIIETDDSLFFQAKPSNFIVAGIDPSATACVPLLEDWGIPSRIACNTSRPGCFQGNALQLAQHWLNAQAVQKNQICISAYGDTDFISLFSQPS